MSNHSEFLDLFLKHQADINAFVTSLVRERPAADDVCQDVALTLWEKFDQYDRQRSFGAWARGIAAKKVMQYWHKVSRTPIPFSEEAMQAIADAFERKPAPDSPMLDALEACLKPLPPKSQTMLRLRYGESFSVAQIAEHLSRTPAAIHKALSRLRTRIQECIQTRLAVVAEEPRQ